MSERFRFRPHRGSLADAMAEMREFATFEEMAAHIKAEWSHLADVRDIEVEPYHYDARIQWDTHLVTGALDDGKRVVLGYTDRPLT